MAGMFEGIGGGANSSEMRLAMARLDALERLVMAQTREHLALAAGVESRLAAIEAVLTDEQRQDLGLAELAKKTPPGGGGDAIAFKHEYMDTATGETERTPKTPQHLADRIRADLNSPRPDAQDRAKALRMVLARFSDAHDGLCAICGEYHNRHLSTCWRPLVSA